MSEVRTRRRDFGLSTLDCAPYLAFVSNKSRRVAALVEPHAKLDAHYAGYFKQFNRQKFYEAHDVLEHLWLKDKHGPDGAFYKGLIQLAGAFVHLQRDHLKPAAALFKLADSNLARYPAVHEHLDVNAVCHLIAQWLGELERAEFKANPLTPQFAKVEIGSVIGHITPCAPVEV